MKYNIVFSVPVHEHYEVVVDLLVNFLHFNPNCAVVVHLSQSFINDESLMSEEDFRRAVSKMDDVFINPVRLNTRMADIIQTHLSNYNYISSICDFDYFSLNASNELFVRTGVFEHIRYFDCGVQFKDYKKWPWYLNALNDKELSGYIKCAGNTSVVISHIEGTFYKKALFRLVVNEIDSFYDYNRGHIAYPREEVYFPVVMLHLKRSILNIKIYEGDCYTFAPWQRRPFYRCTRRDILQTVLPSSGYFSVKRVQRLINDYLRIYIRQNGGYDKEIKKILPMAKNMAILQIQMKDLFLSFGLGISSYAASFARFTRMTRLIVNINNALQETAIIKLLRK